MTATEDQAESVRVRETEQSAWPAARTSQFAAPLHATPALSLAVLRLLILPIVFAGDQLVAHPKVGTTYFNLIFTAACIYGAVALGDALREKPRLPLPLLAILDLLFICGLTYESGGAFSQLHTAFLFLPLGAAILLDAKRTALVAGLSVVAYLVVALVHPSLEPKALDLVLVQGLYLVWVGLAAVVLAVLLQRRRQRILALAALRGRLVAEALGAEERTRRRVADELHDLAIQNLLVARQDLAEAGRDPDGLIARAERAILLTLDQLRHTVRELHPSVIEQVGLKTALQTICDRQAQRGGFEIALGVDVGAVGVYDQLIAALVRELLANVTQHADASSVLVAVVDRGEDIELRVADDGRGFEASRLPGSLREGHIGLASCRERVSAVGGSFDLRTDPGNGTRIRCVLPKHLATPSRSTDGRSEGAPAPLTLVD